MIRVNNLGPCIVLSVIIHSLVFFTVFYQNSKQNVFVAVPFDVSFYSPVNNVVEQISEDKKVEPDVPVAEEVKPKPEVKKKENKVVKSDIAVKKKEKKVEEKKAVEKPAETAPQKEAEQKTSGGGSPYSSKGIMLENKNFKFSYYTNAIVKKISKYWQWSSSISACRAVVYFKINKRGYATDIKIKESSGDDVFDQNAIRAVELASPFPELPESYNEDNLGVYFEFKFR
ncbi:MAG: TonB C-terminal domain-containing protein [Elusimicrobia bacterium]|nr:TonB C-terminal domain-containing protein [Elusimicrobiota bacterium]